MRQGNAWEEFGDALPPMINSSELHPKDAELGAEVDDGKHEVTTRWHR